MRGDQKGLALASRDGEHMSWAIRPKGAVQRVVTAMGLVALVGLASTPVALADTCPNAALRVQNGSSELPECRAYEMVTPPFKQGFDVTPKTFSDDGDVSYVSIGNFAGNLFGQVSNQYLARRAATGWVTSSLNPPADAYVSLLAFGADAQSADLRLSLFQMYPRDNPSASGLLDYYLRSPDGVFTRVGTSPATLGSNPLTVGASDDLSHTVFQDFYGSSALYEFVGVGNQGSPRAVSVNNAGVAPSGKNCPDTTSVDGRVIVYTSGCAGSSVLRIWARVAGSATVAVSGSECTRTSGSTDGECNGLEPAEYVGAAKDGSRVFFTTNQQLVNGDTDLTRDLYACDIPPGAPAPQGSTNSCVTLTRISGTASNAQVESVPVVSDDGSRAVFVAQGVLADNLGVNDAAPVAGELNMYLWIKDADHPSGEIRFIAPLGLDDMARSQMTPDGRYLVFSTASALVTSGPGTDGDGVPDVYRYDVTTRKMVRVSVSVTGTGGNDLNLGASTGGASTERAAVSADGSLVVFETAEALSARDTDGVGDVYAWRDGQVSLISDGGGQVLWVTPSGRDIFFMAPRALTAADGDVISDIYDARVGGGFDLTRPIPCSGDGCQGPVSETPALGGSQSGLSVPGDSADTVPVVSLRAVSLAQRRRLAATGKVTLTAVANVPGTVTAKATATIAGRSITVGSGRRTLAAPGSVAIPLTLSGKARAQLSARGKLTVKVAVTHAKAALGRSLTLQLVRAKAKKSADVRSAAKRVRGGRS